MLNPFKDLGKRPRQPVETISQANPDRLVRVMAAMADRGGSWELIQTYLRNRALTPEQVAQWMTKYGGRWVHQPEAEFGQQLLRLGEVAEGELTDISTLLGRAIVDGSKTLDPAPDFEKVWQNR